MLALTSFETANEECGRAGRAGRRPLGAMLMLELGGNDYKSIQTVPIVGVRPEMEQAEEFLAKPLFYSISRKQLTIAEDRKLREAIKVFVEANLDWKNETVALPKNLKYLLDSTKDKEPRKERVAAYITQPKKSKP
jgi:hypothetical protein